jgi:hypothetical protein
MAISPKQIELIRNHRDCGLLYAESDSWLIEESDSYIGAWTNMDNFDMTHYIHEVLGISEGDVRWGDTTCVAMLLPESEYMESIVDVHKRSCECNLPYTICYGEIEKIMRYLAEKEDVHLSIHYSVNTRCWICEAIEGIQPDIIRSTKDKDMIKAVMLMAERYIGG